MVISIEISKETKEELLTIKKQLELQTGQKCTLEEVISWLLAKGRQKNLEKKRAAEELFGIASSSDLSLANLRTLRQTTDSRFAKSQ